MTGTASDPAARFDLAWSGASVAASRNAGLGALAVNADGTYGGDAVQTHQPHRREAADWRSLSPARSARARRPLALNLTGAVPLSLGNQQLASRGAALQGALDVDIEVTGTTSAPRYSGTRHVGRRRLRRSGHRHRAERPHRSRPLSATTGSSIERLTARSGEGGSRLRARSGSEGGFPVDLTAEVRQARYVDGTLVAARFDADLTMSGSLSRGPTLAGRVFIDRAEVTVPEKLPGSSVVVDVDHRATPAPVAETLRRAKYGTRSDAEAGDGGGSNGISLDILVDAPPQIFVRGRGLDTEVGGNLRVRGPLSARGDRGRLRDACADGSTSSPSASPSTAAS